MLVTIIFRAALFRSQIGSRRRRATFLSMLDSRLYRLAFSRYYFRRIQDFQAGLVKRLPRVIFSAWAIAGAE